MKFKKVVFLVLLMTLCISKNARSAEMYGPALPPGYTEQGPVEIVKATVSTWWNRLKEKVSTLATPAAPATSAAQTASAASSAATRIAAPAIAVLPDPAAPVFKERKIVSTLKALPEIAAAAKHDRYNPENQPAEEIRFPEKYLTNNAKLESYANVALVPVDPPQADELKLVRALLAMLNEDALKQDEAATQLQSLGVKTSFDVVRLKALAFLGYVLEDRKLPTLAALSFARALNPAPSRPAAAKYDGDALEELSAIALNNLAAKSFVKSSTLEKIIAGDNAALSPEARGFAQILLAERAYDASRFDAARKIAQSVPAKTLWKDRARYLAALSAYAAKPESRVAQEIAGRELTDLFSKTEDDQVFDAAATTLGRIHFLLGNYKAAAQYLSQVGKETNIWLEAAIDNGWSLLKSGDRRQAVGNMFSLQTPYFEGAYMPESYFLRTLGYQELCQFGDAYVTLKRYKATYVPLAKSLAEFKGSYYDDLVAYLEKKTPKLHPIALRELGRHPEFLKRQSSMNKMAREQRDALLLLPKSGPTLTAWSKNTLDDSRQAFKGQIDAFLRARATNMGKELQFVNSNMALLEYEVYAGASQNISLQSAQNFAVNAKQAAQNRPSDDNKEYWPFEEEIWEDELNNFRSKIVDGCAHVTEPHEQQQKAERKTASSG